MESDGLANKEGLQMAAERWIVKDVASGEGRRTVAAAATLALIPQAFPLIKLLPTD